jgi:hypothetical protein
VYLACRASICEKNHLFDQLNKALPSGTLRSIYLHSWQVSAMKEATINEPCNLLTYSHGGEFRNPLVVVAAAILRTFVAAFLVGAISVGLGLRQAEAQTAVFQETFVPDASGLIYFT